MPRRLKSSRVGTKQPFSNNLCAIILYKGKFPSERVRIFLLGQKISCKNILRKQQKVGMPSAIFNREIIIYEQLNKIIIPTEIACLWVYGMHKGTQGWLNCD